MIFCTERSSSRSLSSLGIFSIFYITTGDSVTKLSTKSNKDPLSFNFPKHLSQFPSIFPLSPPMSIKLPSAPWPQNQYNIFRFYYDSPPFSGIKSYICPTILSYSPEVTIIHNSFNGFVYTYM